MFELYFSLEKFTYINQSDEIDLNFISKLQKRRLNDYDKKIIYLLNKNYNDNIQEIYFSSKYGEKERLDKMIEDYTEFREVSPNAFSSSVHNFPVSYFTILKNTTIPTYSLSASLESFQNSFLAALTSMKTNILFCHEENNEFISFVINKNSADFVINDSKIISNPLNMSSFKNFILKRERELFFDSYKIEVNNAE